MAEKLTPVGQQALPEVQEQKRKNTFGFLLPGISSTTRSMSPLRTGLGKRGPYGEGNFRVTNSAVFSGEPMTKNRYSDMAEALVGPLGERRPVDAFFISLGAGESLQLLDELEERIGPLTNYKDQLHMYFISPAAPKNLWDSGKYMGKFVTQLLLQEAAVLPRQLPGRKRFLRGVLSFATNPPEDFEQHAATYTQGIRTALGKLSQVSGPDTEIPFKPDPERNYVKKFENRDVQEKLRELDAELLITIEAGGSARQIKRLLLRRDRLTFSEMGKIYGGDYAEAMGDDPGKTRAGESTKEGKKLRRKMLTDTFLKAKVYKRMSAMAEAGMHMTLVVPEGDILYSRKEAEELAALGPNVKVYVPAITTHTAPWGVRPEADLALKNFREQSDAAAA